MRQREGQRLATGFHEGLADLRRVPEKGPQLDLLPAQADLAAGDAGDVEQVFDQPAHVLDLPMDHGSRPLAHDGIGVGALEHSRGIAERSQRVAQLMSQQGKELVFAAIGRGQLGNALAQGRLQFLAARDVLDGEQDQRPLAALLKEPPGVEQHRLAADVLELLFHLEALHSVVQELDLLEETSQLGDVPLTRSELVEVAVFRSFGPLPESLIERPARRLHAQVLIQHQERFAHSRDDAFGVLTGAPQCVDIDEQDHRAVDAVFQSLVRPDTQRIPAPLAVLDLAFPGARRVDHIGQQRLQLGKAEVELDVAERPADVGGDEVEELSRPRCEAPDAEVLPQHDDGHLDAADEVDQIIVELVQLQVAVLQLVIDRSQLLVARLDLLLGRLELFVDALELLVGRLHLLIGGLQLFVGGLLLLDHRLEEFTGSGQLLGQPGILALGGGRRDSARLRPPGLAPVSRLSRERGRWPGLFEQDEKTALRWRSTLDGNHLQIDVRGSDSGMELQSHLADRGILLPGLLDGGPQRGRQPRPRHPEQVQAGLAGRRRQIRSGVSAELQNLQIGVDQHARRYVSRQQDAVGFLLYVGPGGLRAARAIAGPLPVRGGQKTGRLGKGRPARGGFLGVGLVLGVGHLEQVR